MQELSGPVIYRTNMVSNVALGFSVGYFLTDLTYMFQNPFLVSSLCLQAGPAGSAWKRIACLLLAAPAGRLSTCDYRQA